MTPISRMRRSSWAKPLVGVLLLFLPLAYIATDVSTITTSQPTTAPPTSVVIGTQKQRTEVLVEPAEKGQDGVVSPYGELTKPLMDSVLLAGNRPVGTYLCSYFPHATSTPGGGCILPCEDRALTAYQRSGLSSPVSNHVLNSKINFTCEVVPKASPSQLFYADIVVNHHGPVPKKANGRPLITLFYSGESNASEGKKAKAEYQLQYDVTVSFHQFRKHFFTWTHRHKAEFDLIRAQAVDRFMKGTAPSQYLSSTLVPEWRAKIPAIAVFVSRCKKGGRDLVIKQLGAHFPVHSFGKCARTHTIGKEHPECLRIAGGQGETGANRYPSKLCVFRKYQYVLALDNTREQDYVTEKVYHALLTGAVPLYDGAPNVADFLPGRGTSSVIRLQDFAANKDPAATTLGNSNSNNADVNFAKLGEYLKHLSEAGGSDPEVEKLLEWRADPMSTWSSQFIANVEKEEPTCGVCGEARLKKSLL